MNPQQQVIDDLYYPSLAVKRAAITTVTALCLSYCDLAGVPEDLPMLPNPPYQPSAQLQTVIWEVCRSLVLVFLPTRVCLLAFWRYDECYLVRVLE